MFEPPTRFVLVCCLSASIDEPLFEPALLALMGQHIAFVELDVHSPSTCSREYGIDQSELCPVKCESFDPRKAWIRTPSRRELRRGSENISIQIDC